MASWRAASCLLLLSACAAAAAEPDADALLRALLDDPGLAPRAEVEEAPANHFDALLTRYDTNLDQALSPTELAGRDLVRLDRDHSGQVTLADFPGESGELEPRIVRALDARLARRLIDQALGPDWMAGFRRLDLDRDRRLSRAELEAAAPERDDARRDPFGALLDSIGSWDDDYVDWLELDAFLAPGP